jgi:hypothetical protein
VICTEAPLHNNRRTKKVREITQEKVALCARYYPDGGTRFFMCKGTCATYYPDGKFLKAQLKSGSSYTWQSIFYGIQTFNRGCIWRVGDGDKLTNGKILGFVQVQQEKYIPQEALFC